MSESSHVTGMVQNIQNNDVEGETNSGPDVHRSTPCLVNRGQSVHSPVMALLANET